VPVLYPIPLFYTPRELGDVQRTIASAVETCDIGFLVEGESSFTVQTAFRPADFREDIRANEAIRLRIVATGQNVTSSEPIFIQIAWNGVWNSDRNMMRQYLIVREGGPQTTE
jgi:hypothetical protein